MAVHLHRSHRHGSPANIQRLNCRAPVEKSQCEHGRLHTVAHPWPECQQANISCQAEPSHHPSLQRPRTFEIDLHLVGQEFQPLGAPWKWNPKGFCRNWEICWKKWQKEAIKNKPPRPYKVLKAYWHTWTPQNSHCVRPPWSEELWMILRISLYALHVNTNNTSRQLATIKPYNKEEQETKQTTITLRPTPINTTPTRDNGHAALFKKYVKKGSVNQQQQQQQQQQR